MDELKIESKFMRGTIAKIMSRILRKKLGYKINIQVNDTITAKIINGKVYVHLNLDAEMDTDELTKFTKIMELKD